MLKKRCKIEDGNNVVGGIKDAVGGIKNVVGGVNINVGGVKPPLASADREPEQKNESQNNPNQIGCPVGRTRHFCGHQPEAEDDDVFTCLSCATDGRDLQSGNNKIANERIAKIEPIKELVFVSANCYTCPTSHIAIINPSCQRLAFKIKSTNPAAYCVQPHRGFVEGQSSINVLITANIDYQHSIDKDRFAVLVMRVCDHPLKNNDDLAKMWCRAIKTDDFMERRLKCTIRPIASDQIGVTGPSYVLSSDAQCNNCCLSDACRASNKCRMLEEQEAELCWESERLTKSQKTLIATVVLCAVLMFLHYLIYGKRAEPLGC